MDYDCNSNWCTYRYSPVLIDLAGDGFAMTSASGGVVFDFLGNGHPMKLSWTAPGANDAWLALDRNGNGRIDNGMELFGNATLLPGGGKAPNGFDALAVYDLPQQDGNNNGVIDAGDAIYSRLRLWVDSTHDGVSQPNELRTLAQARVLSIDLKYHQSPFTDQYGNRFRYRAKVTDGKGDSVGKWAFDVFLQRDAGASVLTNGGRRPPAALSSQAAKQIVRR